MLEELIELLADLASLGPALAQGPIDLPALRHDKVTSGVSGAKRSTGKVAPHLGGKRIREARQRIGGGSGDGRRRRAVHGYL